MGMGSMSGMSEVGRLALRLRDDHFRVPVSRCAWAEEAEITVEKMAEDVEISRYIWDT